MTVGALAFCEKEQEKDSADGPVQHKPVPESILKAATEKNVIIRDVEGKVYKVNGN